MGILDRIFKQTNSAPGVATNESEDGFVTYQLYIGESTALLRDVAYGRIDVSAPGAFQSLAKIMVCPKCGLHDVQIRENVQQKFVEGSKCPRPGCNGRQVFKFK